MLCDNTYPTCKDDSSNNRNKREVSEPSLPLERHKVGKNSNEEGHGGANGLVKRHGEVVERDAPEDNGDVKNEAFFLS